MSIRDRGARVRARAGVQQQTARIARQARRANADLHLQVAPTAQIGRIDVRCAPGTSSTLTVGEHTTLDDGVEIRLGGGTVHIGDWVDVRGSARMMVSGALVIAGENILSWGTVIHCAERITLERQSTFGEYVTIVDSAHDHIDGAWHADRVHTAPVRVGVDTWVAAKATITQGVTIGAHCIVAGSAVVTRDVPDRHLAVGIPAVNRVLPPAGSPDRLR